MAFLKIMGEMSTEGGHALMEKLFGAHGVPAMTFH